MRALIRICEGLCCASAIYEQNFFNTFLLLYNVVVMKTHSQTCHKQVRKVEQRKEKKGICACW